MSRSGYTDDPDGFIWLYRRAVENAIGGKRGQEFLRDLIAALDALPNKRLIADYLESDGEVCAIGAVGVLRGVNMSGVDPSDSHQVAKLFGIASCMAAEIVFENDELCGGAYWVTNDETPEARWQRMRDWATQNLKSPP